jgi:hypothetical protein
MGKRLSVDEKLSAVRRLRELQPASEVTAELRLALRDKSNIIVAAAASIAGDQKHVDLIAELEAAFERFLVDPEKTDKLCRAKIAIVQGLDKLAHEQPEIFRRASKHVQFEPVWGGQEDSAAPLRAAAILALARIDGRDLLPWLVDALVDPQKEVRTAAAQALGCHGTEPACLLLRLKARMGDSEPDVVSECLFGLLGSSSKESLPFVAGFLDSPIEATREAAILALGRSRLPEAFELLKAFWEQRPIGSNETVFVAIAMLRLPLANGFLLELIASGPEKTASAALSALMIYRYDPSLNQLIADAVQKSGSRNLKAKLERDTGAGD